MLSLRNVGVEDLGIGVDDGLFGGVQDLLVGVVDRMTGGLDCGAEDDLPFICVEAPIDRGDGLNLCGL